MLGRVVELCPGDDGLIRSVRVKRGDGTIHLHSIKLLYPLELSLTHNAKASHPHSSHTEFDDELDESFVEDDQPEYQPPTTSHYNLRTRKPRTSKPKDP